MMIIDHASIHQYSLPLCRSMPLKSTLLEKREGLIVQLQSGDRFGYGDVAPLPDFSHETIKEALSQLQAFCCEPKSIGSISLKNYSPSVVFGIESALWWLRQYAWKPALVNAPLLNGAIDDIVQRLQQWQGGWPREFKLKIGKGSLAEDEDRIKRILDCLPESVRLKIDANQRWTFQQAIGFGRSLVSFFDPHRIAYIEEPTSNADEFPEFYRCTGIPYALDETIQSQEYQFSSMPGLTALILKPTLVGGLLRCQRLMEQARRCGIRTIFSSSFESALGLHVLQQISASWTPEELPGLDTDGLFLHNIAIPMHEPGQPWQFFSPL